VRTTSCGYVEVVATNLEKAAAPSVQLIGSCSVKGRPSRSRSSFALTQRQHMARHGMSGEELGPSSPS
jgi:hypothetical protein